jgi:uncharacterized membrane protein YcaP (DUF421 family)
MTRLLLCSLGAYVFLLAMLRLSGKRVLAEATGMQFVLALIIGDLVDEAVLSSVPFLQFVVAAGALIVMQLVVATAAARSGRFWRFVEGEPVTVLQNGMPRAAAMRGQRMNRSEIASLLRLAGLPAARWAELKRAQLEEQGRLSLDQFEWARPAVRQDSDRVRDRLVSRESS